MTTRRVWLFDNITFILETSIGAHSIEIPANLHMALGAVSSHAWKCKHMHLEGN